jgi:hypothetical protein
MTDNERLMVSLIRSEHSQLEDAGTVDEVVSDAIHHTVIEGQEAWVRISTEPPLRSVEAVKTEGAGGWSIAVAVTGLVRPHHAAYQELRQAIEDAIEGVPGVTEVEHEVNEMWWANGSPSGQDLTRAVAHVLDEHADRLRNHFDNLKPGTAVA